MNTPQSHESAAFISRGDAGVLVDALTAYLMREDVPLFRREQALDLHEQFVEMTRPPQQSQEGKE